MSKIDNSENGNSREHLWFKYEKRSKTDELIISLRGDGYVSKSIYDDYINIFTIKYRGVIIEKYQTYLLYPTRENTEWCTTFKLSIDKIEYPGLISEQK